LNKLNYDITITAENNAVAHFSFYAVNEDEAKIHAHNLLDDAMDDVARGIENFMWTYQPTGKLTAVYRLKNGGEWKQLKKSV
jgi:hypothetical protein